MLMMNVALLDVLMISLLVVVVNVFLAHGNVMVGQIVQMVQMKLIVQLHHVKIKV